jgi:hypothetical protein
METPFCERLLIHFIDYGKTHGIPITPRVKFYRFPLEQMFYGLFS